MADLAAYRASHDDKACGHTTLACDHFECECSGVWSWGLRGGNVDCDPGCSWLRALNADPADTAESLAAAAPEAVCPACGGSGRRVVLWEDVECFDCRGAGKL